MKNYVNELICLAVVLLLTASCSPFKPKARQSPAGELPRTFSLYTAESEPLSRWWEVFNDPDLNALITQALSDNLTIKGAWSRLNQTRALAVQAGAALYPDLTGTAGASFTRQRSGDGFRKTVSNQDYSLGIISSYELDLWGRIRSGQESALLEVTAAREDLNTVAMTLAAEVANRWINITSQRMQKRLLESQIQINLTYLELIELRFRKAMVSGVRCQKDERKS